MIDVGRFVGRYLQVLGGLSIAWMVISPIFLDHLRMDLSFILMFWAAAYLIKHNATARKWTLGICGFSLVVIVCMVIYVMLAGTEHITLRFGFHVNDPAIWQVVTVSGILCSIIGLPFTLLLTPQAKREFRESARA